MIPLIRVYFHCGGILGPLLCILISVIVTFVLTRKFLVDFLSPLLDFSVLCNRLGWKFYK